MTNRLNSLLKKVDVYEKIAVYGSRSNFLRSFAQDANYEQWKQEQGVTEPLDPITEDQYKREYDAQFPNVSKPLISNKPVRTMPSNSSLKNSPSDGGQAIRGDIAVVNKYLSEFSKTSDKNALSKAIDDVWQKYLGKMSPDLWTNMQKLDSAKQELQQQVQFGAPGRTTLQKSYDDAKLALFNTLENYLTNYKPATKNYPDRLSDRQKEWGADQAAPSLKR